MEQITLRKLDHAGNVVVQYEGLVLFHGTHELAVQTGWLGQPRDLGYVFLETGDHWTEYYYDDRWYNVFEIRTNTDEIKGWYCNVTRPTRINERPVDWEDLALDLWVQPDGAMSVLDEDEFELLPLSQREQMLARAGLTELIHIVEQRRAPFDKVVDV